jgi:hypothetical protein
MNSVDEKMLLDLPPYALSELFLAVLKHHSLSRKWASPYLDFLWLSAQIDFSSDQISSFIDGETVMGVGCFTLILSFAVNGILALCGVVDMNPLFIFGPPVATIAGSAAVSEWKISKSISTHIKRIRSLLEKDLLTPHLEKLHTCPRLLSGSL